MLIVRSLTKLKNLVILDDITKTPLLILCGAFSFIGHTVMIMQIPLYLYAQEAQSGKRIYYLSFFVITTLSKLPLVIISFFLLL